MRIRPEPPRPSISFTLQVDSRSIAQRESLTRANDVARLVEALSAQGASGTCSGIDLHHRATHDGPSPGTPSLVLATSTPETQR